MTLKEKIIAEADSMLRMIDKLRDKGGSSSSAAGSQMESGNVIAWRDRMLAALKSGAPFPPGARKEWEAERHAA